MLLSAQPDSRSSCEPVRIAATENVSLHADEKADGVFSEETARWAVATPSSAYRAAADRKAIHLRLALGETTS